MTPQSQAPRPATGCSESSTHCRHAAHQADEIDAFQMTPLAIVRAEVLAAVDELLETFHARG
ncbi:MAG: hypothetical protein ACP5EN_10840 [Rhodovulum sp.]